jgi:hypothetical protein
MTESWTDGALEVIREDPGRGGTPTGAIERNGSKVRFIRLLEGLRCYRLLMMPETPSKSDRRHGDDDCNSEQCAHRESPFSFSMISLFLA